MINKGDGKSWSEYSFHGMEPQVKRTKVVPTSSIPWREAKVRADAGQWVSAYWKNSESILDASQCCSRLLGIAGLAPLLCIIIDIAISSWVLGEQ